jgi:hypothetical protein
MPMAMEIPRGGLLYKCAGALRFPTARLQTQGSIGTPTRRRKQEVPPSTQYGGSGLASPRSRLAGGCLSSCTVDSEESEAYSEEEDSECSEDEEFEWTWSAMRCRSGRH